MPPVTGADPRVQRIIRRAYQYGSGVGPFDANLDDEKRWTTSEHDTQLHVLLKALAIAIVEEMDNFQWLAGATPVVSLPTPSPLPPIPNDPEGV